MEMKLSKGSSAAARLAMATTSSFLIVLVALVRHGDAMAEWIDLFLLAMAALAPAFWVLFIACLAKDLASYFKDEAQQPQEEAKA